MLTARDIMTRNPVTVTPETGIVDAVKILLEKRFNGLPVVGTDGRLLGVICQSDLVAQQKKLELPSLFSLLGGFISMPGSKSTEDDIRKIAALTVGQAMTANPVAAAPDTTLEDLATLMVKSKYYTLPVLEEGRVVGVVGKEDILRTVIGA